MLLRVLEEETSGATAVPREVAEGAYAERSAAWPAVQDQPETLAHDLAEWNLVSRSVGSGTPTRQGMTTVYDGSWSARVTDAGRDLTEHLKSRGL